MSRSSQGTSTQRSRQISDSEDDEPTQRTQSSQGTSLANEQRQNMVNDVIYYLLVSHQKKTPVKKSDLNKLILKEYSRHFSSIFDRAKQQLKSVFGIKIVELTDKRGQFILVNAFKADPEETHLHLPNAESNRQMGFLTLVLALIFMNGNQMTETAMWQALKQLGFDPEKKHAVFQDVKMLLTKEFVRQSYLEYRRVPDVENPTYDFTWGQRAKEEISKLDLLNVICQIYGGGVKPEQWTTQYSDATKNK